MAATDPKTITKIIQMRKAGMSFRRIGEELGLDKSTAIKWWKARQSGAPEGGGAPDTSKLGQVVTGEDGSVEVLREDRLLTPEEMAKAAGLGPEFVCRFYRPNICEGFCKMRTDGEDVIRKVKLFQTKAVFERAVKEDLRKAVIDFAKKHVKPIPAPRRRPSGKGKYCVAFGIYDAHIGMHAWSKEVGEDYDLDIVRSRIMHCVSDVIADLARYPIDTIWIPVGNDLFHCDGFRHTTAFSDHPLDMDSRFGKVYSVGLECMAYLVEQAAAIAKNVDVLWIGGNHDYTTSYTLAYCLAERYRKWSGIKVDVGPQPRKIRHYGKSLLMFAHGDRVKAAKWPLILAEEARDLFATARTREVHIGHTHQKREVSHSGLDPLNGVLVRTCPSLTSIDFWHAQQGFLGDGLKGAEAYRYDQDGFRGSHAAWAPGA